MLHVGPPPTKGYLVPLIQLRLLILLPCFVLTGCAVSTAADGDAADQTGAQEGAWDSAGGNPTHATHSYLVEYAIDGLRPYLPELQTYRAQLVAGANQEIHDVPLKDPNLEALRIEVQGTNGACARPDRVWAHARDSYTRGDKPSAYWYVGLLMHYVSDMGVPAHALGVYHQSSPSNWDHFELMAFQKWSPSYGDINRGDPAYASPADYVAFSGAWTASDFGTTWPGVTYTRTFYSRTWLFASSKEKTFMRNRQGRTAEATRFALWSAGTHLP